MCVEAQTADESMPLEKRHLANLLSGTTATLWHLSVLGPCDDALFNLFFLLFVTTITYHGAHVCGKCQWADKTILKYDFIAVSGCILRVLVLVNFDLGIVLAATTAFLMWLLTFIPMYRHVPLNPVISLLHIASIGLTTRILKLSKCV